MTDGVLRLLHFADLHLGVEAGGRTNPATGLNQRVQDVCDRLDEVCETVERDQVHAVLFCGDAFKNQHPTPTLQTLFAQRIRRLQRTGAAVFLLVGNHDLPKMSGLAHPFSIYDALEYEGVVVGERAAVYRLALPEGSPERGLQVAALPHFSRHQVLANLSKDVGDPETFIAEQVAATVRSLCDEIDPRLPAVFCGHCHVNQADLGTAHPLFGASDVEVSLSTLLGGKAFAYYALGHVHRRQVLSDDPFCAYSGSLERVDHGEGERVDVSPDGSVKRGDAEAKGFYRFDLRSSQGGWHLAAEPEFRTVGARPFVTVRTAALDRNDPSADLGRRIGAVRAAGVPLAGAFVKITGRLDAPDKERVTRAAARELLAEAYDVALAIETPEPDASVRDPRFAERMGERRALERYLESREDWAPDREELLRLGYALIEEVTA